MSNTFTDSAAILLSGQEMSCKEFLRAMHLHGALPAALRSTAIRRLIDLQAEALGIVVSEQDLQLASDQLRRRSGLHTATETHAWLQSRSLSVLDLEEILLQQVRRKMVFQLVTSEARKYFDRHCRQWDRLTLRSLTVASENLASELKVQILEDGADISTLAQKHSTKRAEKSNDHGQPFFRCHLPKWCRDLVDQANIGELVGPAEYGGNWTLLLLEEVQSASYDASTEDSVRQFVFRNWLSRKLRESNVTYPLLELLACSQNS